MMTKLLVPAAMCMAAVWSTPLEAGKNPAVVAEEFIYDEAPFAECHASTLVETTDGELLAAWFGGSYEKHPDVGIWISRRQEGRWSPPVEVVNGVQSAELRYPCWNPVLFQPAAGPLLLFFKVGPDPQEWWGEVITSDDGGKTWRDRRKLPGGLIGPVKNKPVQLKDGTLLCGSSTEHDGWRVHFESSPDLGRTWSQTQAINDGTQIGAIQPSILRYADGRLQALGRSRQRRIWESWSNDQGQSWNEMKLMELPNPNSGTDAVTLADGRQLLVYNHTPRGRSPLNVAVSSDGENWQAALVLENEPGEYSYPAVIQTKDGLVHMTYTWKRLRIRHVAADPEKLELREIRGGQWPAESQP